MDLDVCSPVLVPVSVRLPVVPADQDVLVVRITAEDVGPIGDGGLASGFRSGTIGFAKPPPRHAAMRGKRIRILNMVSSLDLYRNPSNTRRLPWRHPALIAMILNFFIAQRYR
jgi:hypothetical protein